MKRRTIQVDVLVVDDEALGEIVDAMNFDAERGEPVYFQVNGYGVEIARAEEVTR